MKREKGRREGRIITRQKKINVRDVERNEQGKERRKNYN